MCWRDRFCLQCFSVYILLLLWFVAAASKRRISFCIMRYVLPMIRMPCITSGVHNPRATCSPQTCSLEPLGQYSIIKETVPWMVIVWKKLKIHCVTWQSCIQVCFKIFDQWLVLNSILDYQEFLCRHIWQIKELTLGCFQYLKVHIYANKHFQSWSSIRINGYKFNWWHEFHFWRLQRLNYNQTWRNYFNSAV